MGAGNVCTTGRCEGLYYIDKKFFDVYSKVDECGERAFVFSDEADDTYEYDELESEFTRDSFEYSFMEIVKKRYPSFDHVDKWISRSRRALLENKLFYIVTEDNQGSVAIELIQKESEYGSEDLVGLQMGLYLKYLEGIKNILLDMYGEVKIRTGAWTSGVIMKG